MSPNRPSRDGYLTDQEHIRHLAVTARNAADPDFCCGVCSKQLTADQLGRGATYCSATCRQRASRDRRGENA